MMRASDQRISLVALVTGASRGIGSIVAQQLAERGVRVALHHRSNRDAAEATLERLPGTEHEIFAADLGNPTATTQLWNDVIERFGQVDVLINRRQLFTDLSPGFAQSAWAVSTTASHAS
jgi:3-oxoacyl-[acyl-carrier protein] reductase